MSGQWQAKIGEREFDSEVYDADGDMLACELTATQARVIAAAPELLESLRAIFGYIERGELVRDITKDAAPDWAPRMAEFVTHLGKAQAAIAKAVQS